MLKDIIIKASRSIAKNPTAMTIGYTISLGAVTLFASNDLKSIDNNAIEKTYLSTNANYENFYKDLSSQSISKANKLWSKYKIVDYYPQKDTSEAEKLLNKFPMLELVLNNNYVIDVLDNNYKLKRK